MLRTDIMDNMFHVHPVIVVAQFLEEIRLILLAYLQHMNREILTI